MSKNKLTVTQWVVMCLLGCVFTLEFAMVLKAMFGARVIAHVIGFFIPFTS